MNLWREAMLVAGKDLRIEARSRVTLYQVLPFGLIVVLLFAFALDPSRGVLARVAPGLFWVAVLLAALLAVSRSFQVETENAARDGLRLSGLDPAAVFLGKAGAIAVQLAVLEVALGAGVALLYDVSTTSSCARSGCSWRRRWPRLPAWPPPVPSTAFWLQVCACARRSSRCCCCR